MAVMRWDDRVYGEVTVDDPGVLALIDCPTFQRLQGIKQAGPSALAFPFKTVTRFEHSLGVYLLLGRLGADRREQVAGLLHDISHTAFSHAVDFVFASEEQDHHEGLKPEFLRRPDIVAALARDGLHARGVLRRLGLSRCSNSPCPASAPTGSTTSSATAWPAAVTTPEQVARFLAHLTVVGDDDRLHRRRRSPARRPSGSP